MFQLVSDSTAIQREEKEREIKGVVVQWRLPVYDVSSAYSGFYRIQTKATKEIVGTFCYVRPQNDEDRRVLARLREGDYITCKGYIDSISMRN